MANDAIRSIPGFPEKLASELKHCIIAHHGELEYGSPKKPALAEAMALNLDRQRRRQDADIKRNIQRQKSRRVAWI